MGQGLFDEALLKRKNATERLIPAMYNKHNVVLIF